MTDLFTLTLPDPPLPRKELVRRVAAWLANPPPRPTWAGQDKKDR